MRLVSEKTVLDELCEREQKRIIRDILREIHPKHALIIRLRYWEEMKYSQIALIISSTSGAVGGTLAYAKKKLSRKLAKY